METGNVSIMEPSLQFVCGNSLFVAFSAFQVTSTLESIV